MKKFFNKAVLNGATVIGDGLTYPRIPNVYTGGNEGGYQRGDMMDANAVVEMIKELTDTGEITIEELQNLINEEIQERVEGDKDQQRYTDQKIKDLIGTSPETLDTLKEIADALGEDPDFAANVWNKIAELTTKHNEDVQELQDAITSGFENIDFTPYVKKTDVVTDTTNGLMLASDKVKLDAFKEAKQYAKAVNLPDEVLSYIDFYNPGGGTRVLTTIRNLSTGKNKYGEIRLPVASSNETGLMSSFDKQKLDSLKNYKAGNGIDITGDTISCTLDTSLYSIVTELPETGLPNKIYLLPSTKTEDGNIYTEYGYVDNKWEEIGKYKADVDLSPYERALNLPSDVIKTLGVQSGANYVNVYSYKEDLDRGILSEVSEFDIPKANNEHAGIISSQDKIKLDGIEEGAQVNTIESITFKNIPIELIDKTIKLTTLISGTNETNFSLSYRTSETDNIGQFIYKHLYGLSTNGKYIKFDDSNEDSSKLIDLSDTAKQAIDNAIQSVSVNGTPLEITNKSVNIPSYELPIATDTTLGGIKVPKSYKPNPPSPYVSNPLTLTEEGNLILRSEHVDGNPENINSSKFIKFKASTNGVIGSFEIYNVEYSSYGHAKLGLISKTYFDKFNAKQDALTEAQLNNINNAITSISVNNVEQVNTNGAVDLTIPNATPSKEGLMSKEDKAKLNSQPTIKASDATGVTDDDYVVIKKSELNSILSRLSALENKA